ncbi:DNA damage-regulated autophagy modulator protein [Tyrophagus putrescentiae]|nr:DNA damage-regulated autophagy modulator protein [Tyrophagus putrescentiae]
MEEETESPGPSINWAIILPSLFTCLLIGLLVICYANGLVLGHYHFLLPMVSDTGNFIPEAAIFSFGVTACAVLWMMTVTIRYVQLRAIIYDPRFVLLNAEAHRHLIRKGRPMIDEEEEESVDCGLVNTTTGARYPALHRLPPTPTHPGDMQVDLEDTFDDIAHLYNPLAEREWYLRWNLFTYLLALAAGIGALGVASFRVGESLFYHYLAGFGLVSALPIYVGFTVHWSGRFYPAVNSKPVYLTRLYIAFVNITALGFFVSSSAYLLFTPRFAKFRSPARRLAWSSEDHGYWLHVLNSFSEWVYIGSLAPFVFTFEHEISRLGFDAMKLSFVFGSLMPSAELRTEFKWHPSVAMHRFHVPAATLTQNSENFQENDTTSEPQNDENVLFQR